MRRHAHRVSILLPVLGVALGYGAFALDNALRVTTLHEEFLGGNQGEPPGTVSQQRQIVFAVERPDIEHTLFLSPTALPFQRPRSAVDIAFSLHDPAGQALLPEKTERFEMRSGTDWEAKFFPFVPPYAGTYTLRIRLRTAGIPRVHVRIVDPEKRNGFRMPGY